MDTTAKFDNFEAQPQPAVKRVSRPAPPPATRTVQRVTCTGIAGVEQPFEVACHIWGTRQSPTVVCVHGMTRNARDFDPLAQRLAQDLRVVCIDLPGRGDSDRLSDPSGYS